MTADSPYLKELISLRTEGYSWSAIARHLNKDRTTIKHHWENWVGTPSATTKHVTDIPRKQPIKPSWDGNKYLCCNSFLHKHHTENCPNVAGDWQLPHFYQSNFKDFKAVVVNKYDHILDDDKRLGKSYQQLLLKF